MRFARYEPSGDEPYANGKRLAGRVAQRLSTYTAGTTPGEMAAGIGARGMGLAELKRALVGVVDPARRSAGKVLYAQLSGVNVTSLGAMVVVRQHLEDTAGRLTATTRVMDVRLRRDGGAWSLDRIGSVGGSPVARPRELSPAAERVLDDPHVVLSDTARWDILRGDVDDRLLRVLAEAAERRRIAVTVLRTGHPPTVWATERPSAHASGYAADIYAVDDTLVLHQRSSGTPAHQLATSFLEGGAAQVGSPWALAAGGGRSFTDEVHQDHLHVQQTPLP